MHKVRRTPTRGLNQHLARALVAPFAFLAAALLVIAFAQSAQTAELAETPAAVPAQQPSAAERLVERHGCWTGAAPADVEVPGHVVVTWPGAVSASYGGRRAVGAALEHVFGDERRGMVVHGFCR